MVIYYSVGWIGGMVCVCGVCVLKAKLYNGLRNNNANPFLLIYFTLHEELVDLI
jgi:predicted permease